MDYFYPNVITVLTTYQCTAHCKECCFECSPNIKGRISLDTIKSFVEESNTFLSKNLKAVIFTGGECFLLKDDLLEAIRFVTSKGLLSRCVSNGFWATSEEKAKEIMWKMKDAGLTELNISTGDDHQQFVSFDSVLNASFAASEIGIDALIVVEGHNKSNFKYESVLENPRFQEFKNSKRAKADLRVISNIWIPFHEDTDITQDRQLVKSVDRLYEFKGCDNILTTFGINPYNQIVGCCGLTMEHIPEMKLGEYKQGNLENIFRSQFNDFMKLWLWVEGPERILYFASCKDPSISFGENITHNCQVCVQIFKNKRVKEVLLENWEEVFDEVMFKYSIKVKTFTSESSFF